MSISHDSVRQWYLKFRQGLEFPDKARCAAAEDNFVPSTIPVAPFKREYWNTFGKDDRLISAVMGAEALWIAEHEKLLLQRLREQPASA